MDAAQQETGKGKKSVRKSGLMVLPPGQRYCRTEKHPAQHERNRCRTTAHMCVHTNTQTQVAILEEMRLEHPELGSTADQRAMPCGRFSGGFSFSQEQMGFS